MKQRFYFNVPFELYDYEDVDIIEYILKKYFETIYPHLKIMKYLPEDLEFEYDIHTRQTIFRLTYEVKLNETERND